MGAEMVRGEIEIVFILGASKSERLVRLDCTR